MRRTERLQGLRLMKFEEVYARSCHGELSRLEAAESLGMSERTFRRWRDRFEAESAEGFYDRRPGRASARRGGADEVPAARAQRRPRRRPAHCRFLRRASRVIDFSGTRSTYPAYVSHSFGAT